MILLETSKKALIYIQVLFKTLIFGFCFWLHFLFRECFRSEVLFLCSDFLSQLSAQAIH